MDEKTQKSSDVKLAVIANDIGYIKEKLSHIEDSVNAHYVTKDEFEPIKRIVYGLVSLILIAVVGALINLVVQKG